MGVIQRGKKMTKKSQKKASKPVRKTRPRKMKVGKVKVRRRTMKAIDIPPSDVLYYPSGKLREEQWVGEALRQRISEDLPVHISYYDNPENTPAVKTWRDRTLAMHRTSGPAYVEYYENGQLKREEWRLHGSLGREGDGPIIVEYRDDGSLWQEIWVNENEDLFREDGPALIEYYPNGTAKKSEKWYTNEDYYDMFIEEFLEIPPHNDIGPAVKEYYEDGTLKREVLRGELVGGGGFGADIFLKSVAIEYYPDGTTKKSEEWYIGEDLENEDDQPAVEEYYPDGRIKSTSWYKAGELHREGDAPAVIEFFQSGVVSMQSWYRSGIPFRGDNNPAVEKYNEAGEVIEQMWFVRGRFVGNVPPETPSTAPQPSAVETSIDVEKNVSLFYETCQMNFEADSGRADVDDETKEKIIAYSLDPIIYLGRQAIRTVLAFYDGVPQTVHDKNSTFRELVFNERHTRFLTSEDSLRQSMIDARLVVTQWVSWYYQHTRIDARSLISRLRDNISKIREYLPNIYKPEMYADLFEAFFFGNVTINDLSSPNDSNKYKELNFYLHAGDESGFADRIIDKMMTGLRNYNYLHEWVDAKLEENDTSSLEKAKELCKIGKAGEGWLCGDGLFDTIPQLLSEAEGEIEWKQLDPDHDKNDILNLWMIGQTLMKNSGKTKAEYTGYDTQEFKKDLRDILWANKTFRTKWGYNDIIRLETAFGPNGAVERISNDLGMSILESIYDSLPE